MRKKYKIIICLLCLIIFANIVSCNKNQVVNKDKKLNVYVDIKDKHSLNIIKFLLDEYKKENADVNVNITNAIGGDVLKDVSKGTSGDIVFTSRNKMIELQNKGFLSDLSSYYDKYTIKERYYNIMTSYGRYSDKYYGIGIMPYTIEILYNKEVLDKCKINEPLRIQDVENIAKKLNQDSIKVPVILTDDLDVNNALASLIISNKKNIYNVDNIYNSSAASYKEKKEFQNMFDSINNLYKKGIINKNIFEIGNENTLKKLSNSDIPVAVSISYYSKEINDENIGIVQDYSGIGSFKGNVPVIINALLCIPVNNENGDETNEFIKFVYSDETQKKLLDNGFITGNKKVNEELKDNFKIMEKHLEESNENSILFIYNLPDKFRVDISSKIDSILTGKYSGKEWEIIIEDLFKYGGK
ncbi:ABC transporter substrate-binding protein [Clostridium rectalis]|uniref:ABC transporter substrate-binding protein n=1 Tax=Clostridium rectalis TaxID=2040295 RepID=UPI0013DDA794|nr:extracellular solute-binding protein [Clostridium rectalis]